MGRHLAVRRLAGGRCLGRRDRRERDAAAGPVAAARCPGVAPDDARPRRVTDSRPAVLGAALAPGRVPTGERIAFTARDGLRLEGTLWRPIAATGKRGGQRVPTIVYPHGGPTWQAWRDLPAVQAAAHRGGLRGPRRRLPRLDRLRARVPPGQPRRVGPRRRPRRHRRRAVGGRAAVVGRAARHLRRVVRRLRRPVRARRGAVDVARRRRPVRRLGDRRELSPRRPGRPPGPVPDDGLARRARSDGAATGAARRSIGPSGSRRRCSSSTAARTSGSCRS